MRARSSLPVWLTLAVASAAAGSDPYADAIVAFEPGENGDPAYATPAVTLGAAERFTGEGVFPSVVSIFNPPFGPDEIVSIGRGGMLVVRFDEPVTDDPANPWGIDLLVFGNAGCIDIAFPSGIVGGIFGADGGGVDVSADGLTWVEVPGVTADGMYPTLGYRDGGPYDDTPGLEPTDFTRPVDPSVTINMLDGLDDASVRIIYGGSGGGVGIDLASVGLAAITHVRIRNPLEGETALEIDAFSDVSPTGVIGDVTGDGLIDFDDLLAVLSAWGPCSPVCPADLDGTGDVAFGDLLLVLANWTA